MRNAQDVDGKKRASFSERLKALRRLPVPEASPKALAPALGLTVALESPPPVDQRLDERRQGRPRPAPTRAGVGVDLLTLSSSPRPRDRMWKAERTWKGIGRHGEGKGEASRLESVDEEESVGAGLFLSHEPLEVAEELLGDAEVDQGVEDPPLVDPLQLPRR